MASGGTGSGTDPVSRSPAVRVHVRSCSLRSANFVSRPFWVAVRAAEAADLADVRVRPMLSRVSWSGLPAPLFALVVAVSAASSARPTAAA